MSLNVKKRYSAEWLDIIVCPWPDLTIAQGVLYNNCGDVAAFVSPPAWLVIMYFQVK